MKIPEFHNQNIKIIFALTVSFFLPFWMDAIRCDVNITQVRSHTVYSEDLHVHLYALVQNSIIIYQEFNLSGNKHHHHTVNISTIYHLTSKQI